MHTMSRGLSADRGLLPSVGLQTPQRSEHMGNVVMFPVKEDGKRLNANQAGLDFTGVPGNPLNPVPGSAGSCSVSCLQASLR